MPKVIDRIQRARVWPGSLQVAHWLIALGTLALMVTGWLVGSGQYLGTAARDFHLFSAWALTAGIALRIWLLFTGGSPTGWRDLLPDPRQYRSVVLTLRFYLSLGRAELPRWYAHNPLWGPVYLLVLGLLCAQALTGFLVSYNVATGGVDVPAAHALMAQFVAMFTLLHLAVVVAHDLRGPGADISGMISGYRIFESPRGGCRGFSSRAGGHARGAQRAFPGGVNRTRRFSAVSAGRRAPPYHHRSAPRRKTQGPRHVASASD